VNIIGLGSAGCALATKFEVYPQYNIYKIDSALPFLDDENYFRLEEQDTFEEYEKNTQDLTEFLSTVSGEAVFIVGGGGNTPGASLWILEHIKDCKLHVIYIKPDTELFGKYSLRKERALRGILQEYARSGLFENICLIDNTCAEDVIGNVPVIGYYEKLNGLIANTKHMVNVFQNTPPLVGARLTPLPACRIYTIGIVNVSTGEEKLLYPLDLVREKMYHYAINRKRLEVDGMLAKEIKKQVKNKRKPEVKVSYGIYSTEYKEDYAYCLVYTSKVQLEEKTT